MGSISKEMETQRNHQIQMLWKIVAEMKNTFDELINRLETAEENKNGYFEDRSIEASKLKFKVEKKKKDDIIPVLWELIIPKSVIYAWL